MRLHALNSPVLTTWGRYRFAPLDVAAARALVRARPLESAIGHAAAAELLAALLGIDVPVRRVRARMDAGDRAIVLRLLERLPEGRVLDADALRAWPHELALLVRES